LVSSKNNFHKFFYQGGVMRFLRSYFKVFMVVFLAAFPLISLANLYGQALSEDFFKAITYREIGPTRQSGRFSDFAVPLQQPYTFYAATGSGGLWKTVNNGQSFEPIFDNEKVFSIGDIAVAPSNPNIVWVGTGEANTSRSTYYGDGVYKSTDAGKTWKNMGLKESHHIGRIIIHPTDPNIVYAAALGHLYSPNPDRGLYMTRDGGKTWIKSLDVKVGGRAIGAVDVVMDPKNSNVVYASTYDKHREPWNFQLGGPGSGIHKSTDGGKSWKKLAGGLPAGILGRIGLTIYPRNTNILYAVIENANKPGMSAEDRMKEIIAGKPSAGMIDGEVYRTDDAGATWKKVSPEKQSIGSGPGYYYCDIIVDPNNDKHVYALSVRVQESKDGGKTWGSPFNFGGDNHALWIDPGNSNHMLLGYDHGMGVTFDGGKNWFHPDVLPLAQFYAVDYDMSFPYRVAGGLQDNGSHMGPSTKKGGAPIRFEDWQSVGGGDGMYNVFDKKTNRYLYNESQFGPLSRLDLLTGESKSIAYSRIKPTTRWNWCAPIVVSAHDSSVVYHTGNIVVKSTNRGDTWTEISTDLTTNDPAKLPQGRGGDGNIQYCTITTMDESPLVPGVLWVGTDDGNVWVTRDDGKNWTKLNDKITGNPGTWVSRVAASNSDPGTAYVAYSGFRQDDFRPFIYKTTDYGQTWVSIAANLPNETINVVREGTKNPNLLFVGTDFAVYVSLDGGKSWTRMKGNMPTQPVHDLKVHPREKDLIVATHGRGIFIADISALEEVAPEVLAKSAHLFSIEPKVRWAETSRYASSFINFNGRSEPAALAVNYYLKAAPKADVKIQIFKGNMLINELKGTSNPGLNSVLWNMTQRRERTEAEKKALESQRNRFADMGGEFAAQMRMQMDPNYVFSPAAEGEYKVVLIVDNEQFISWAEILQDLFK
jgi:photosystem II stability/assembly factor-like uncharacterized protein